MCSAKFAFHCPFKRCKKYAFLSWSINFTLIHSLISEFFCIALFSLCISIFSSYVFVIKCLFNYIGHTLCGIKSLQLLFTVVKYTYYKINDLTILNIQFNDIWGDYFTADVRFPWGFSLGPGSFLSDELLIS